MVTQINNSASNSVPTESDLLKSLFSNLEQKCYDFLTKSISALLLAEYAHEKAMEAATSVYVNTLHQLDKRFTRREYLPSDLESPLFDDSVAVPKAIALAESIEARHVPELDAAVDTEVSDHFALIAEARAHIAANNSASLLRLSVQGDTAIVKTAIIIVITAFVKKDTIKGHNCMMLLDVERSELFRIRNISNEQRSSNNLCVGSVLADLHIRRAVAEDNGRLRCDKRADTWFLNGEINNTCQTESKFLNPFTGNMVKDVSSIRQGISRYLLPRSVSALPDFTKGEGDNYGTSIEILKASTATLHFESAKGPTKKMWDDCVLDGFYMPPLVTRVQLWRKDGTQIVSTRNGETVSGNFKLITNNSLFAWQLYYWIYICKCSSVEARSLLKYHGWKPAEVNKMNARMLEYYQASKDNKKHLHTFMMKKLTLTDITNKPITMGSNAGKMWYWYISHIGCKVTNKQVLQQSLF